MRRGLARWIGLVAFAASLSLAQGPKNVIVLIGDGCGYNQLAAGSCWLYGEPGKLPFERFPVRLGASTFSSQGHGYDAAKAWDGLDYLMSGSTDSAAAATALACGLKTLNKALGVDPDGRAVANLAERARAVGKATGVVTSVQWSHATPAGFVVHNPDRNDYAGIAREMLASNLSVIMGAGHPEYDDRGRPVAEVERDYNYVGGADAWSALRAGTAGGQAPWTLIESREQFRKLAEGKTPERVVGTAQVRQTLQEGRPMSQAVEPFADPLTDTVPTLTKMSRAALNVLDDDPDGLFVMIEGGAIDWAGHSNRSGRLIEEVKDFADAIEAVVAWVERHSSWRDTLVIITADHETGCLTGSDGDQYTDLRTNGKGKLPEMHWHSKSHTNQLVPLFAKGAGSESLLARATHQDPCRGAYLDNTDIAKTIFALWAGPPMRTD